MAKAIMVQGTMSNAGKSLLAAGLCRIFKQDGYRVAPFKSQNMALNSFITKEGLEMGRAQVMQAEAAGIEPSVLMNPILLKPTNDVGSQVIVNGEVLGTMSARDYFAYKKKLVPDIMKAFDVLAAENDIIVIEGAGSPAEINRIFERMGYPAPVREDDTAKKANPRARSESSFRERGNGARTSTEMDRPSVRAKMLELKKVSEQMARQARTIAAPEHEQR